MDYNSEGLNQLGRGIGREWKAAKTNSDRRADPLSGHGFEQPLPAWARESAPMGPTDSGGLTPDLLQLMASLQGNSHLDQGQGQDQILENRNERGESLPGGHLDTARPNRYYRPTMSSILRR